MVRGKIDEKTAYIQARSFMARAMEVNGKACEAEGLSWNHCTSTPHRSETNVIAERAVRRVKEGTSKAPLLYCCNQVWMKIGEQIPWNATPICETSQISYLMEKLI